MDNGDRYYYMNIYVYKNKRTHHVGYIQSNIHPKDYSGVMYEYCGIFYSKPLLWWLCN